MLAAHSASIKTNTDLSSVIFPLYPHATFVPFNVRAGGLYVYSASTLLIEQSSFMFCGAPGGGGAVYLSSCVDCVLRDNNFTANGVSDTSYGGAVFTDGSPNMFVTRNVFTLNFAGWGVFTWNCSTMEEPRGLVLTNHWEINSAGYFNSSASRALASLVSAKPSASPTAKPSRFPTHKPSHKPTRIPTEAPTSSPSMAPTLGPTTFLENVLWATTIFALKADDSVRFRNFLRC